MRNKNVATFDSLNRGDLRKGWSANVLHLFHYSAEANALVRITNPYEYTKYELLLYEKRIDKNLRSTNSETLRPVQTCREQSGLRKADA